MKMINSLRCRKILFWIAGIGFLYFLLNPQRFAPTGSYSSITIKEKDIEEGILSFAASNDDINSIENSNKSKKYCQININKSKVMSTSLQPYYELVQESHSKVQIGGTWSPSDCVPIAKVHVIIAFRNREKQLEIFLQYMHFFLQTQNIQYTIVVSEQSYRNKFNRAKLFNIGYLESQSTHNNSINCVIFHDVDLIPLDIRNIYGCSIEGPRHLSSNLQQWRFSIPYEELFGGVIAVSTKLFKAVNGFSNEYFGWGGEDDDFRYRIQDYQVVRFEGQIARYTMLRHQKETPNPKRFDILRSKNYSMNHDFGPTSNQNFTVRNNTKEVDGLSNTQYNLISVVKKPLYTHILSDF